MSLINFSAIRELVSSGTAKHKQELFQETMLMVLARATRVDSNVDSVEAAGRFATQLHLVHHQWYEPEGRE